MRLIDHSEDSPAMNLALDEVLLDSVETGQRDDTLRLWESPRPFVVIGTAQAIAEEAHEPNCAADGVPVLRRCSAGGCVLQGAGCLNYALALRYTMDPALKNLHSSYTWILGRVVDALRAQGVDAAIMGISDLAVGEKKFSGNAQRRRRNAMLHHGTLLYRSDPVALARYLREPATRPDYRGQRTHGDFVAPLSLTAAVLREAVASAFAVDLHTATAPSAEEFAAAQALATGKYVDPAWTHRR